MQSSTTRADHPLIGALLFALPIACASEPPRSGATIPTPRAFDRTAGPTPCELARTERERVPALLDVGHLDRVLRVLDHADALCPDSAPESAPARLGALVDVGRVDDALKLAQTIDTDSHASDAARAASKAARLAIATPDTRNSRDLYEAGRAAGKAGHRAEMQRLFDEAIVSAERSTGKKMTVEPPPERSDAHGFAWSRDGSLLAVVAGQGVSIREKRAEFRETLRLEGPSKDVTMVAFSPDGKVFASSSEDNTVRFWNVETGVETRRLVHAQCSPQTNDSVDQIAFSPDSSIIATGSADGGFGGCIRLWDVATGSELRQLEGFRAGGGSVDFSRDGKTITSDSWWEGVHVWNVQTGSLTGSIGIDKLRDLQKPTKAESAARALVDRTVTDLKLTSRGAALSPDGSTVAVDEVPGMTVIDVATKRATRLWRASAFVGNESKIAVSPDGKRLISGAGDHLVRLWDLAPRYWEHSIADLGQEISSVAFAPDGQSMAAATTSAVYLFDGLKGQPLATLQIAGAVALAFSPDGKTLAAAGSTIELRRIDTGASLRTFDLPKTSSIRDVGFSVDGAYVAAADGKTVRLWEVATGTEKRQFKGGSLAFAPTGRALVTEASGILDVWDFEAGRKTNHLDLSPSDLHIFGFAKDSSVVAFQSAPREIKLWNISDQETSKIAVFDLPGEVAFVPHQKKIFVVDNAIRLWSFDGKPVLMMRPFSKLDASYLMTSDPRPAVEITGTDRAAATDAFVCRAGVLSFPFELCREHFEVLNLLPKVLSGETTYLDP